MIEELITAARGGGRKAIAFPNGEEWPLVIELTDICGQSLTLIKTAYERSDAFVLHIPGGAGRRRRRRRGQ